MDNKKTDLEIVRSSKHPDEANQNWSLFVVGDVSPKGIFKNQTSPTNNYISKEIEDDIKSANISIANHEGPVEVDAPPITKSGPTTSVDLATPPFLRSVGFEAVTLANNHIMDYGVKGLDKTIELCQDVGLDYCGAGNNLDDAISPLIMDTKGGTKLAFVNACEREFGIAGEKTSGSAWISHPRTLLEVVNIRSEVDVVIVVAHGGVENIPIPPIQRQTQLRSFIEAGADVVFGHHPHVPQGWEQYQDGYIFYSLGNFLFNRTTPTPSEKKEQWGLTVEAQFNGSELISFRLRPTEIVEDKIYYLGKRRNRMEHLKHLHELSAITSDRETLEKYWQEIAVDRFIKYYGRHLYRTCTGNVSGRFRYPVTRRHRWNQEKNRKEMLWLLNHFRNESHSWLISTALNVLSGATEDQRTPEIQQRVDELLEWTLSVRYERLKDNL